MPASRRSCGELKVRDAEGPAAGLAGARVAATTALIDEYLRHQRTGDDGQIRATHHRPQIGSRRARSAAARVHGYFAARESFFALAMNVVGG
jgi:hypothetical protein